MFFRLVVLMVCDGAFSGISTDPKREFPRLVARTDSQTHAEHMDQSAQTLLSRTLQAWKLVGVCA